MKLSRMVMLSSIFSLPVLPALALEVEIGGQINRAAMYVEDGYSENFRGLGSNSELYHVDNRNSPSRINVRGTQRLLDGWTAGALLETGMYSNLSTDVSPQDKSTSGELEQRITDGFVDSPFGKITLGRGEGAAYATGRRDYSGTGVISFRHPGLIGGGLYFDETRKSVITNRNASGNVTSVGPPAPDSNPNKVSIIGSIRDFNFEGRHDRIRYDSPRMGPVTLSVSTGHGTGEQSHNSILEVGARAGVRVLGGRALAGLGYSRAKRNSADPSVSFDPDDSSFDPNVRTYGGSVSWIAENGINVTFAALNRVEKQTEASKTGNLTHNRSELAKFRYVKLGYRPSRKHAFDVHWGVTKDRNKVGDVGTVIGAGYVWSPTHMFDAYAGAKVHSFKRKSWETFSGRTSYDLEYEDISVLTTGIRVKF
ncbi:porin [Pseudomonas sp. MYb185]|uniref:porin n=1 Tax=Pseudomonas sp. MYb185 TaxID=1848729 RepID=UPI000CFBF7D4|nr:porin [Pseudomonas sp. MYb185]PRB80869.1 porin [Pseudomonas sp. MYb185]